MNIFGECFWHFECPHCKGKIEVTKQRNFFDFLGLGRERIFIKTSYLNKFKNVQKNLILKSKIRKAKNPLELIKFLNE